MQGDDAPVIVIVSPPFPLVLISGPAPPFMNKVAHILRMRDCEGVPPKLTVNPRHRSWQNSSTPHAWSSTVTRMLGQARASD